MRLTVTLLCIAQAACTFHGPPSYIVPLAELLAEMRLDPYDESLSLVQRDNGEFCRVLSPRNTKARLDGRVADEIDPGGPSVFSSDGTCRAPTFTWDSYADPDGPSTFEISDGSATWTFVIWQPFATRRFEVTSHDDEPGVDKPITAGDTVVLAIDPPTTLIDPYVTIQDGSTNVAKLTLGAGLTQTATELSFVMPDFTPATQFGPDLLVGASYELRIDQCDATRGCMTVREVSDRIPFSLVP